MIHDPSEGHRLADSKGARLHLNMPALIMSRSLGPQGQLTLQPHCRDLNAKTTSLMNATEMLYKMATA